MIAHRISTFLASLEGFEQFDSIGGSNEVGDDPAG